MKHHLKSKKSLPELDAFPPFRVAPELDALMPYSCTPLMICRYFLPMILQGCRYQQTPHGNKGCARGDTPFIPRNKLGGERNLVFFGVAEALYINRLFSLLTLHFGRLYESLSAAQFAHSACAVKFSLVASQSAFNIIFLSYRYYYHAVYLLYYWSVISFLCLYLLFRAVRTEPSAYFLRIDGTFLPPGGCKGSKILQNRTYPIRRPPLLRRFNASRHHVPQQYSHCAKGI